MQRVCCLQATNRLLHIQCDHPAAARLPHLRCSKLLSLIGQGGGSVASYCEGHLPDTRVVALPSLHG